MKFYAFLSVLVVVMCPGVCLMWIILLGTINWHDALDVTVLVAIVYMIRGMRREDRAAERAVRRVNVRRFMRHERSGLDDSIHPEWVGDVDIAEFSH